MEKESTDWIGNIQFVKDNEKNEFIQWCQYIGYQRYYDLYEIIQDKDNKVSYDMLKSIAKYDFQLSDIFYSMIKFVECCMRGFISNLFVNKQLNKKSYLYEIIDILKTKKQLPCDTYYDCKKLKEQCSFDDYLSQSAMSTLNKIFKILPDEKIISYLKKDDLESDVDISNIDKELKGINNIRNKVAHNKILIDKDYNYKKAYKLINKYIPSKSIIEKRKEEISKLNKKYENSNIQQWLLDVDEKFGEAYERS